MEIEPIAFFRSPFAYKFGIPKQSGLADTLRGTIKFVPKYRNADALRGMDISFVTTAQTDEEAKALLKALGAPFAN